MAKETKAKIGDLDAVNLPFIPEVHAPKLAPPEKAKEPPVLVPGETVPGGRYIVDGVLVDCNGKPIKE